VIARQHVWVGPDATSFEVPCEVCAARRDGWPDAIGRRQTAAAGLITGTIRRDADVGFTTCRRGHRVVVRRVGRAVAALN
jgi:hypothetical protein